jgi:hypothetical protein
MPRYELHKLISQLESYPQHKDNGDDPYVLMWVNQSQDTKQVSKSKSKSRSFRKSTRPCFIAGFGMDNPKNEMYLKFHMRNTQAKADMLPLGRFPC